MIPAETAWTTIAHFIALCIATSAFFAALGINVYVVVALTDLQNDFMNPHDAARRINRLIWFEILAHCVGTGAMALSGSFLLAIVNVPLIVWHVKGWQEKHLFMDVTEIFNAADGERKRRTMKIAFIGSVTLVSSYKVIRAAVMTLLTAAGREAAAKILREAAHSPMYHMF